MNKETLDKIIEKIRKASPVIVRRRDGIGMEWEDADKIYDYIRENFCRKEVTGDGISYYDMNKGPAMPITPELNIDFKTEKAASEFYKLMEKHKDYYPALPEGPIGLAGLTDFIRIA